MSDYRKLTDAEKMYLGVEKSADLDMGHLLLFGKILLAVAGADGKLPEAEMLAFWQFMSIAKMSNSVREELENFDFENADLEALISQGMEHELSREASKRLVAGAIRISMADGEYHEKEREAIFLLGERLGLERSVVVKLEYMIRSLRGVIESNMLFMNSI